MEHQDSLPVSQEPSPGPYRTPRESSPHHRCFPFSTPVRFPSGRVLTRYLTNILKKIYFSFPTCKLYLAHLMCLWLYHPNKDS